MLLKSGVSDQKRLIEGIKIVIQARHYQTPGFSSASADHGQFSGGQAVHEPYGVAQAQHPSSYAPGPSVPVSFAGSSQIRGKSHFCVYVDALG